ncbi:M24 family metallopeptidase [Microbacterium sp. K24]|uniref:M24 family metallopeptidase n=1 Tax=Microbacterium sp. K24 TaxID=2305446 RepID=UPI00109D4900|nr:M24 family metallopeptidase [Microbacterium sp. K24]
MFTRYALSSRELSTADLVENARLAGLDAVEVDYDRLSSEDAAALVSAKKSGVQTTSIDLGSVADPRTLEGRLSELLALSAQVGNRRFVITGGASGDSALDSFIEGLRWLADQTEPLGFALVVRVARPEENAGQLLHSTRDLRVVLARTNRGNVSARADLSAFLGAGEEASHSTADLVGRLGHASLGAADSVDVRAAAPFLDDLSSFGYADVVRVEAPSSETARSLIDALGGNKTFDADRVNRVQEYIADDGLDAIVLNASKNIVAATGYWPMNGTILALIPRTGTPHLFVPAGEETWASRSGWQDIHVYQAGRLIDPSLHETVAKEFGALADSLGLAGGRIGIEGPFRAQVPPHMAHEVSGRHESLRPVLEDVFGAAPVFMSDKWTRSRAAKTEAELRGIRRAAAIADVGLRTFRDGIANGVRDIELGTEVESKLELFGVGRDGVSRVRGYAFVMSGPQTSQCHLDYEFSSTRVQRTGDNVLMELAVVADGYWQDLSRAFVIGEASLDIERIYEVAEASFVAAQRAAVPGATGHDVDAAARQVVEDAGMSEAYPHQTGHGVGVAFHEQYPLIKPGSDHLLEAGNVIAIEPGVYIPGIAGIRNEDNLVVGDPTGATSLQTVPHAVSVAR